LLITKKSMAKQIAFLKSYKAMVFTSGPSSLGQFIGQRKRWASKSIKLIDADTTWIAVIIVLQSISLIFMLALSLFLPVFLLVFLIFLVLRILSDSLLIWPVLIFFKKKHLAPYIILLELLHPWYICSIALASLMGKYKWKGRYYRK
jgi:hypothetical protein